MAKIYWKTYPCIFPSLFQTIKLESATSINKFQAKGPQFIIRLHAEGFKFNTSHLHDRQKKFGNPAQYYIHLDKQFVML